MKEDPIKYLMSFMENFNTNPSYYSHHFQRTTRTEYHGVPSNLHYPPSHFGPRPPPPPYSQGSGPFYSISPSNPKNQRPEYGNPMDRQQPSYSRGGGHMMGNSATVAAAAMSLQQRQYNHMMMNQQLPPPYGKDPIPHNSKIPSSQPYHPPYLPSPMTPSQPYPKSANSMRTHDNPLNPFHMQRPPNPHDFYNQSRYSGHFLSSPLSSYQQQAPRQHSSLPTCNTSLSSSQISILNYYSVSSGEAGTGSFTPHDAVQRSQILKNNPLLEKLLDHNSSSHQQDLHRQQVLVEEEPEDRKPDVRQLQVALHHAPPDNSSPKSPAKSASYSYPISEPPPPVASADSGISSLPPSTPSPTIQVKQEPPDPVEDLHSRSAPPPPSIPVKTASILEKLGTQISTAFPTDITRPPDSNTVSPAVSFALVSSKPSQPPNQVGNTVPSLVESAPQVQNTNEVANNIEDSQARKNSTTASNTARKSFARMKLTPTLKDKEKSLPSPQPNIISEDSVPLPLHLSHSTDSDYFPSSPESSCNSVSEMDLTKSLLKIKLAGLMADKQAKSNNKFIAKMPISSFTCPLESCSFETGSIFSLTSHLLEHDENLLPIKKVDNYECILCRKFNTHSLCRLTYHIHKEINYTPYQCRWCDSAFIASNFFVRHCRLKHSRMEPTPKIAIDPKMKTTADILVGFIERTQKVEQQQELRAPTSNMDDYKFFCPNCGVKLRDAIELQRHLYRDERYFPFRCYYCQSAFVERDQSHFRNKHPGLPTKFIEAKVDHIEQMVGQLVEQQKFIRAILTTLKKSEDKKCILGCDYEPPTDDILEMHVICHLSAHPFKCPYCFVTTNTVEKMRFHLARYHKRHPIMILETKEVLQLQGGTKSLKDPIMCISQEQLANQNKVPDNSCILSIPPPPLPEGNSNNNDLMFKYSSNENSVGSQDLGSGKRSISNMDPTVKKRAKSSPHANKKKAASTKPPPPTTNVVSSAAKPLDPTTQLSSSTLQMLSDGYFKPVKKQCPAVKALLMQRQILESLEAPEYIDVPVSEDANSGKCLEESPYPDPPRSPPNEMESPTSASVESNSQGPLAKPLTSRKSLIPPGAVIVSPEPFTTLPPGAKLTARKSLIPLQASSITQQQMSTMKRTARKSLKEGSLTNLQRLLIQSSQPKGPTARKSFPLQRQAISHYRKPSKFVDLSKVYHMLPFNFADHIVPVPVKLEELPFDINPTIKLTSVFSSLFVEQESASR